jgi:glycosyltransferase involved in cell wall biosynthesis
MALRLAIDASRARSGGAIGHLVGLLSHADPDRHGFEEIHIWSYPELLSRLPERPWLVKHAPVELSKNLLRQILWQAFSFPKEVKARGCGLTLNVSAGTFSLSHPCVTISQDMLSYEPGEMQRYPFSGFRLRLEILLRLQNWSLTASDGAIFLTDYAARVIQSVSGPSQDYAVVAHGVDDIFRACGSVRHFPDQSSEPVRCLYVSNTDLYKHQWHVVDAVALLRKRGFNITLTLAGGGKGVSADKLRQAIDVADPDQEFVECLPFLDRKGLVETYARSDLVIFASSCENLPITLIEGMASGLPIACSNRGPMPEVLRDGGMYFDPEAPESISEALEALLTDAALRSRVQQLSSAYAKEFTWERCADGTFAFLRKKSLDNRVHV